MSPLLERTEMTILGNKTAVVMTPVWFFYINSTWVKPSSLGINIS